MIGNEFTCHDRNGISVSCSHECRGKHIVIHKEMVDQQAIVKAVVEKPLSEYQDVRHVDTHSFYKNIVLPSIGSTLIKVSVQYAKKFGTERGYIKTAYATNKVKKGEVWLWGHKLMN